MKLVELLIPRMKKERYRPSDLADALKKSRAVVSLTLKRDIEQIRVRTLKEYLEVVGVKVDFTRLLNEQ